MNTSQNIASEYHLSWRSWSSPHGLVTPLGYSSDEVARWKLIWSIPTTLGYSNFRISPRRELDSGSGIGGISSVVEIRLYSRSTTTTYNNKGRRKRGTRISQRSDICEIAHIPTNFKKNKINKQEGKDKLQKSMPRYMRSLFFPFTRNNNLLLKKD